MRTFFFLVLMLLAVTAYTQKKQTIFNGKNLKGWTIFVSDPKINPVEYVVVRDGVIEAIGVPNGYLRTKKEYSNYKLHVEWYYPATPANSGVMLHTNGDDKIWVGHYQAQLKNDNAGDFIVHGVGQKATIGDSVCVSTETVKPLITKLKPSNEKPAGEWNSMDITCKGNTIEIKVNGLLQNIATDCSHAKGSIGLQFEGAKIKFRNLWVEQVK